MSAVRSVADITYLLSFVCFYARGIYFRRLFTKQGQLRPLHRRRIAMPSEGGFTFATFLTDVLTVFVFVVWFWLLIIVFSDLFRRHDISGWGKALWVIGLIVFPYLGVFTYMIFQAKGMAERSSQQARQTDRKSTRLNSSHLGIS